jgi:protoheme IX farnesyltransferase
MNDTALARGSVRALVRDFVALTKPRIISLLLVTTIAPMYVAGRPGWELVLVVFVGGYLMAGGANAVNMYLDRDIDDRMSRTRLRPIPAGRMQPREVLMFGLLLATAATFLLARFANVLTAALALVGFYAYVFLYTRWLKRTTPQNIVIGGAAGAIPPLVGWAAVTGSLDLMATYLFLIVFYWTPPHFWALALNKQRDYGRAGTPSFCWRSPSCPGRWAPSAWCTCGAPLSLARSSCAVSCASCEPPISRSPRGRCTSTRCSTSPCSFWRWRSIARYSSGSATSRRPDPFGAIVTRCSVGFVRPSCQTFTVYVPPGSPSILKTPLASVTA